MNEMEKQTLKALLKKLSAVRMTLSDEEQVLLDEVIAHRMKPAVEPDAEEVIAHRMKPAVEPDADEVIAHRMTPAVTPKVTPDADEVMAHRMKPAVEPDADEVIAHTMPASIANRLPLLPVNWPEIYYDDESETYQIKD